MGGSFTAVDLSRLPVPPILEVIDFQTMFDQRLARLHLIDPTFDALVPSDPAWKILEVCTYFSVLDRQRVNDAARGVMLAYAVGGDLDQLGAPFGVGRLTLAPGNPEQGIPPTLESDEDFRRRIQLSPEGFSVAGPEGAYTFHALSADSRVQDASAASPTPDDIREIVSSVLSANDADPALIAAMDAALDAADWPGDVYVSVLSRVGDGTAPPDLLAAVNQKLAADDVRPLTDHVIVQSAEIVEYEIDADVYTYAGPDSAVVLAESRARVRAYVDANHRLGRDISISGIYAALHVEGVQRVELSSPAGDISISASQAPFCTSISVNNGGVGD